MAGTQETVATVRMFPARDVSGQQKDVLLPTCQGIDFMV